MILFIIILIILLIICGLFMVFAMIMSIASTITNDKKGTLKYMGLYFITGLVIVISLTNILKSIF